METLRLMWFLVVEGVEIRGVQVAGLDARSWLGTDIQPPEIEVRFTPDTVAKLRSRKNRATLIRRHTFIGKNESLYP